MSTTPSDPPAPEDTPPVDEPLDEPAEREAGGDDEAAARLQSYLARFGYRGGDPRVPRPSDPAREPD